MARTSFFVTIFVVVAAMTSSMMPAVQAGTACICNRDAWSAHCGGCTQDEIRR
ncbi:hypothetical protein BG015_000399, partial [Linnemannia schmuckeri]